jgi:hypothetical protein
MGEAITVHLPEETLHRYRWGAAAARKPLEEFLADRLVDSAPPAVSDAPALWREELETMAELDDETLWEIARSQLPSTRQRTYSRLLHKNSQGTLTEREQETLRKLGDEARVLTLKKAQAYLLLKWRGHRIPTRGELQRAT